MENPATWGEAEHIVNKVLHERQADRQKPIEEQVIGLSLVRQITDALRQAGLLARERA